MLSFDFMLSLCTFLFLSSEFLFVVFGGISLQDDDDYSSSTSLLGQKKPGYHAPVALLNDIPQSTEQVTFFLFLIKTEVYSAEENGMSKFPWKPTYFRSQVY